MKFLVDENIAPAVVIFLRKDGHDISYVAERARSFDDQALLKLARKENRVLITKDKDFGELVFKKNYPHSGVIFLRLANDSSANAIRTLKRLLDNTHIDPRSSFTVLDETTVRVAPKKNKILKP